MVDIVYLTVVLEYAKTAVICIASSECIVAT